MPTTFVSLPLDLQIFLNEYLSIFDIVSLSRTCQRLRTVYGASSWKRCTIVADSATDTAECPAPLISKTGQPSNVRCIPAKVFHNPNNYSWFFNNCVQEFWLQGTVKVWVISSTSSQNALEIFKNWKYYTLVYEHLRKVKILDNIKEKDVEYFENRLKAYQIQEDAAEYGLEMDGLLESILTDDWKNHSTINSYSISSNSNTGHLNDSLLYTRLDTLSITDTSVSFDKSQQFEPFSFPKLRNVTIDVLNPYKAKTILTALKALPSCTNLTVKVGYYRDSTIPELAKIKVSEVICHLEESLPLSKPKLTLSMRNYGQNNVDLAGYWTKESFKQQFGQITLTHDTCLKGFDESQYQLLLQVVNFTRLTQLDQPRIPSDGLLSSIHSLCNISNFAANDPYDFLLLAKLLGETASVRNVDFKIVNSPSSYYYNLTNQRRAFDICDLVPSEDLEFFANLQDSDLSTPEFKFKFKSPIEGFANNAWACQAFEYLVSKIERLPLIKEVMISCCDSRMSQSFLKVLQTKSPNLHRLKIACSNE